MQIICPVQTSPNRKHSSVPPSLRGFISSPTFAVKYVGSILVRLLFLDVNISFMFLPFTPELVNVALMLV